MVKRTLGNLVAIDPGREKCGIAYFSAGDLVEQKVVSRRDLPEVLKPLLSENTTVVLGDRTGSSSLRKELLEAFPSIHIVTVDEHRTSDEAKKRYWLENKPRGLRRLVPTSFQLPPVPIDGYVAVILGERYLQSNL